MSKKNLLDLFFNRTLNKNEAKELFTKIITGKITTSQIIYITTIYNIRYPTIDEVLGFQEAIMNLSIQINLKEFNAIDIVGTGGDGKNTFNISTLACLIVAGTGEKVIKHGSFNFSSITGSSNILKQVGYKFTNKEYYLKKQLENVGICYLHSPMFHPLLKNVYNIRKELGIQTIFNIIGPLINPGFPKNQLLGVSRLGLARIYYYFYQKKYRKTKINYSIIHSIDGYDEITLTNDVKFYTRRNGEQFYYLHEININHIKVNHFDIVGKSNTEDNLNLFIDILSGNGTDAQNEVVLMNATFALNLLNKNSFRYNYDRAKHSLKSGKAIKILKKLVKISS